MFLITKDHYIQHYKKICIYEKLFLVQKTIFSIQSVIVCRTDLVPQGSLLHCQIKIQHDKRPFQPVDRPTNREANQVSHKATLPNSAFIA